jgi:hypothetical protein
MVVLHFPRVQYQLPIDSKRLSDYTGPVAFNSTITSVGPILLQVGGAAHP